MYELLRAWYNPLNKWYEIYDHSGMPLNPIREVSINDNFDENTTVEITALVEVVSEKPVFDRHKISDGYHTFGELYEHRNILWLKLCEMLYDIDTDRGEGVKVWKSKTHSDGSSLEGWFLLGYESNHGKQITYHLPIALWDKAYFATELDKSPEFDGHTSKDVLERIKNL